MASTFRLYRRYYLQVTILLNLLLFNFLSRFLIIFQVLQLLKITINFGLEKHQTEFKLYHKIKLDHPTEFQLLDVQFNLPHQILSNPWQKQILIEILSMMDVEKIRHVLGTRIIVSQRNHAKLSQQL